MELTDDQLKKMHFFIHAFTEIMEKAGGTDDDWKLGAGTLRGMILTEPEGEARMLCPVDGATLEMSSRHGIEIDYCPKCRGVWLDRGELEKIVEREAVFAAPVVQPEPAGRAPAQPVRREPPPAHEARQPDRRRDFDDDDDDDRHKRGTRRGRGGFLSELFDFD